MKAYLANFFETFDYPTDARVALTDTYDRIMSDQSAGEQWNAMIRDYETNINCDYSAQLNTCKQLSKSLLVSNFSAQLLIFICHSRHLRRVYAEREIDDAIWYNSMLDLKAKLFECYEVYGVWGSFVASWFPRFFDATRFALGRLQFETDKFKKTYEKDGVILTEDSTVINVHIPRTLTPLSPSACDDAFRTAAKFYEKELNGAPCAFVCTSWLLFPEHHNMLPQTSNIRAFMNTFDILDWGYYGDDGANLWRLFDTMERNPDRLPANSTLRRAYIDRLRRGEKLGWGFGVYCPNFKN